MASLTNPLATVEQLYRRSTSSELPPDLQEAVFFATQCLTQAAGLLLELPQSVTAQANVVLARFWLVDSPMADEFSDVSAASLYLVAKMGSFPRSPRDVSTVYAYLLSPSSAFLRNPGPATATNDPASYYQTEDQYYRFQKGMLELEARILFSLSFNVHVALPHGLMVTYLQTLDFLSHSRREISLRASQYLNTALLSPQLLYLTHQPHALATAAIYNAARDLGASMPECAWWEIFDVDREELGFLVVGMRSLEGWMKTRKEELPSILGQGMPRRQDVEAEMRRRSEGAGDGEDEVMRMMDSKRGQL
ncbi:cyclin-L2 [Cordyceps fumosorosea ARSEF 2679]|uniref:Cyclin-L2 n=1 Tax=Cordyceps fumosorosea (strain ARSEF 2679) TaxID=1081104 RepID=A0A168ETQ4_CORFA|nr:cyclin-L2 [Cordyceps fumosorosea ARSEF 2679]OAA74207.1 cyclin-L2 [Cordyceps fumosorosea ARSEF 2679]